MYLNRVPRGNFLVKTFLKNNVIFNEGSKGDTAYILTEGKVEISGRVSGRKKVFAVLRPVSIFGEMALFLDDSARTATAMALEDCKAVVITRYDLEEYLEKSPQVINTIVDVLVHRLKATTKQSLKVPNVPLGIIKILDLMNINGLKRIRLESAVRHMADTFLVTTEEVEHHLEKLAADGHISIVTDENSARHIVINHEDFLTAVTMRR